MNPIIIFFLFMLVYKEDNRFPNYYDTFKLEQLLEKLSFTITVLDKINHLNELAHTPLERGTVTHTLEDSIHTVKPLLPDGKPKYQLENVEALMSNVKKISDIQSTVETFAPMVAPMLQMLGNQAGSQGGSILNSGILNNIQQAMAMAASASDFASDSNSDSDNTESGFAEALTADCDLAESTESRIAESTEADTDNTDYEAFLKRWNEAEEADNRLQKYEMGEPEEIYKFG